MATKKNNYITNMINQFGENWIIALRPEDIQRSGKKIVNDMVRGRFDYEQVGKYFLDSKFLENLIISVENELQINTLYYNAVDFFMKHYPMTPNIGTQVNHLQTMCYIYNIILNKLSMVKMTSNIGYLADVAALLYTYKNHLN